jgi:TonB-dependent receptor
MRKVLLFIALITSSLIAAGQTGSIKGSVKDAATGDGVIGANVFIKGTTQGSSVDIDGNFEISKIAVGKHTLIVSFISYKTDTIQDVIVYADQTTLINTKLAEESKELTEVVVAGQRMKDTDISVISEIKTGQLVVAGISAQQISLSQDRDAAQVVKRIPGVTIIDNKFVNVRGLSQRYNTVLLNGIIAPSTEVDVKAFAFDLIPSNMIDRMMVYKSGSAEFSGKFAGAVIDIGTKSVVAENTLSVNITAGFRNGTTFKDFHTSEGSKTDFLGFDNGYRQLPSSFPSQNLGTVTNIEDVSNTLPNRWSTQKITAAPDLRTTINFARAGYLGDKKFSNLTSFSYSNTFQIIGQTNNTYSLNSNTVNWDRAYKDDIYSNNSRAGIISNFILELSPKNKIEFRNLFNQQGTRETTFRNGADRFASQNVKDMALNYQSRRIYAGQLNGKHSLNDMINVNWNLAFSNIHANQPDYRNISTRKNYADIDYAIQIPSSTSIQDGGRFFSNLNENVYTQSTNVEIKLNPAAEDKNLKKLSVGYYASYTDRNFDARWFAYSQSKPTNAPSATFLTQTPITEIFKPENIGYSSTDGTAPYFILKEGTSPSDRFNGKNLLTAAYANISLPVFDKFRVSSGIRAEFNKQQLNYFESNGNPAKVSNPILSILPFVNMTFNYSEKSLIRIAYSKTLNRAVFREMANFNFYDFNRRANFYGNPDLKTANIHNLDLRWEHYPSKTEVISVGAFYKLFNNPIEQLLQGGSNLLYTWENADKATSYGVEFEVRESLSKVFGEGLMDRFSVLINAALIKSEVHYDKNNSVASAQEKSRPLQGQSPYVINAGLYYNDLEKGFQANVSYNVFGKRIFAVGDNNANANQYEMPRHQVDVTLTKSFGEKFEAKVGVQDMFNQRYRLTQDSDRNKKINSSDDVVRNYTMGRYFTVGFTYKIN